MKTAFKALLLIAAVGYLAFALVKMSHSNSDSVCSGVSILINDSTDEGFIDRQYVRDILTSKKIAPEGVRIADINLRDIETEIKTNAYIDSVVCYFTPSNKLCVKVLTRVPVLHVMAANGEDYYMDKGGHVLPTEDFNLDLCLCTGSISHAYAKKALVPLADYINTHAPWNEDIQQVNVVSAQRVELITEVGDNLIVLGPATDIEDKMERLGVFIHEGLDKAGWNRYKEINLSFADQVVCTKRDNMAIQNTLPSGT